MNHSRLVIVTFFAAIAVGNAKDLSIDLEANARSAKIGDKIVFTITYTNISNHEIGILLQQKVYEASELNCVRVVDGKAAKRIPFGQANFDINAILRSFKILRPQESHKRKITAKLSSSLPEFMKDSNPGIYLILSGSAIELPSFGKYQITTDYSAIAETRDRLNERSRASYWLGEVHSPPFAVEFRPR